MTEKKMPSVAVIKALAVCAELTDTNFSSAAASVMASDLAAYPEAQILGALARCRKEVKGRLTLQEIVSRLDDGRPGPEAAWSMIPRDEQRTVVWTAEMAAASGVAAPLVSEGDIVAGRMAFLEAYRRLVQEARDRGEPPTWTVSLGLDKFGREAPIVEAIEKGRIGTGALRLLPSPSGSTSEKVLALASNALKALPRA